MDSDSSLTDLSSELSSVRSLSPLPTDYPSPQSSQDQNTYVSGSQQDSRKRSRSPDALPPAKKRKTVEAKPRTTVHLDLRSTPQSPTIDQTSQSDLLLKVLRKRRKIVVIAGAGISTSAGVPDFRSSNGLFNTLRSDNKLKASGKHLFDASVYQTDSATSSFHEMVRTLSKLVSDAKPTVFHEMLATLASEGRLMRLYTQNVDGIDTSLPPLVTQIPLESKGPWPRTVQLHGSLAKMVCSKCNALSEFKAELFNGPAPPPCEACIEHDKVRTDEAGKRSHGIGRLRPRMVLYNEHNPDQDAIGAVTTADLRARPDAVIVVGTSMEIPGVKRMVREMCKVVRGRRDGVAVWINRGPPPVGKEFGDCWDLVVAGDCDKVALRANMRRWNDDGVDSKVCTESEAEQTKREQGEIKVIVNPLANKSATPQKSNTPKKSGTPKNSNTPAMLTPAESPLLKATKLLKAPKVPQLSLSDDKWELSGNHVIKGVTKKTSSKLSTKSQPKKTNSSKISKSVVATKINTVFKNTKPQPKTAKRLPSPTTPKRAAELLASIVSSSPMGDISPQSARYNGPPPSPPKLEFPKSKAQQAIKVEIPDDPGLLKRMREETVSPTGNVPVGMGQLLH